MKKIFVYLVFLLIFVFTNNSAFAENFYIKSYNVKMQVNENKTVDVIENIDVYFTTNAHGIYRKIPLYENDSISDVSANNEYTTQKQDGNYIIKIGNPKLYVNGGQNYKIKYTHKLGGPDNEFYYNIIGTDWNVPINKVAFSITMPKKIDPAKVGLSIGTYGTRGFSGGAIFNIKGLNITGKTTKKLNPKEGITIRIEVPENYFSQQKNLMPYFMFFLAVALAFTSYFIWHSIGKDSHSIPVISFYPPEGYNSAEIELIYNQNATKKGLISLIVWLANKGYLSIHEGEKEHFTIQKKQSLSKDENNSVIYELVSALFEDKDEISDEELKESKTFYKKCRECLFSLNKQKDRFFEKKSLSFKMAFIVFLCILGQIIAELYFLFGCTFDFTKYLPLVLFAVISIFALAECIEKKSFFITICAAGFFGFLIFCLSQYMVLTEQNVTIAALIFICILISAICLKNLPKKNEEGNSVYCEILGFKRFLETVEVQRVEYLVNENPSYCYEILPYLYIFNLTDKWIKKFEQFFTEPPEWYFGKHFNRRFSRIIYTTAEYSEPSTANGGISKSSGGGGGFSGGGRGGGGGGSW